VSHGVLDEITTILGEYPNAKFSIEGHTDSVGSDVSNQKLSESRASSVMTFLIEKGVASNRLTSTGFGESKPIADNATNEGRAQNRRVEINLVK
jgi:outer membrane protein OmpA-like peptidoglycan-associated protein